MCGFILGPHASQLGDYIAHRGIRSKVVATAAGELLHVRLPIVGVGEEHDQPVKAGEWTIAFVGELLDYKERFAGDSCDLDTVVRNWIVGEHYEFAKHDGFWSICAINRDNGGAYLLTDYLAQKPTYYRTDAVAASSEIAPLVAMGRTTPDEVYLSAVCKWGYCPDTQRTPHWEIRKVLPGRLVILGRGRRPEVRYVDPLRPIPSTPQMLKDEIERAVRRRVLSSDVPVASLVSGGLDSAIVHTIAKRHGTLKPYFVKDMSGDSLEAAQSVAPDLKVVSSFNIPTSFAIDLMQEPIDLGSLKQQCVLASSIEERVCLTGDGADELFGGYGRAQRYDSQASDVWHELVAWHLPRLDRIMMRNCVEVRSPFLARRVVQMALGLPRELRTNKKILRDLFRDELPDGIADVPKIPLRINSEITEDYRIKLVEEFRSKQWA